MDYQVYNIGDSLYGKAINDNKILNISTASHDILIIYLDGSDVKYIDVKDDTMIRKHIRKYLKKIGEYV